MHRHELARLRMSKTPKCNDVDDLWIKIISDIDCIFINGKIGPSKWMSIYTCIYDYLSSFPCDKGSALYNKIQYYLIKHLTDIRLSLSDLNDEDYRRCHQERWAEYCQSIRALNGSCDYLNRDYVRKERDSNKHTTVHEIHTLGLRLWQEIIVDSLETRIATASDDLHS